MEENGLARISGDCFFVEVEPAEAMVGVSRECRELCAGDLNWVESIKGNSKRLLPKGDLQEAQAVSKEFIQTVKLESST